MSGGSNLYETGMKNRHAVMGDTYVKQSLEGGSSEYAFPNQQMGTGWCWQKMWSRPSLELSQRSMLNIGILMALKAWPELGAHVRGAVGNGLSELEVREAILQASVYCGVPAGIEATRVAEAVLNDMQEKGEYRRQSDGIASRDPRSARSGAGEHPAEEMVAE
ncbi:4-carboxymuconolactone decarboxylase [Colletotrichum orbiculare MAFF 240422]|uniref:4-carboxymuconolactone decarboxylase n=1 Tax=Colletotrichum orbiculare (strain 104-T / ATCC 96160 / CBS 514.97 / LARS 414 / MAFF 240422) TaxID=1213857 RepID=N4VE56_COLOR|nr:4-carboxymuconolactone decarboxylase [Colletotrichum orbiculare MAFF 240422]